MNPETDEQRTIGDPSSEMIPYFTVGIVGHMNLPAGSEPVLRERIRSVFRWLKDVEFEDCREFGRPLGLDKAPVVLYSPLAPGSDQIAAEVAMEEGIGVRGTLPFPLPYYRQSTSFWRGEESESLKRLQDFEKLILEIGEDKMFPVRHVDDPDDPDAGFWENQLADRELRNRRYRAAGEFVAAHCNLLIAICDQEKPYDPPKPDPELTYLAEPGTRAITASYIRGIRPGILPLPPSLSWQDNGPLVRIYCPNGGDASPGAGHPEIGDIEIWHPADSEWESGVHETIHKREMTELRVVAGSLERLAVDLEKREDLEPDLDSILPVLEEPEEDVRDFSEIRNLSPRIDKLMQLFTVVDKLAIHYDRLALTHTNSSYIIGLLVFLCLAFYEAGYFQLLFAALGLTAGGFVTQVVARKRHKIFQKREDYRALAEGLRVQIYWSAAGLSQSVPSNYLQRLRGDVAWIRAAIDSVVIPAEKMAGGFNGLECHRAKYHWLRRVWRGWLVGQHRYFDRATYSKVKMREILNFLSYLFLVGGSVIVLILFVLKHYTNTGMSGALQWALVNAGSTVWYAWLALFGVFFVAFKRCDQRFSGNLAGRRRSRDKDLVKDIRMFHFYRHWSFRGFWGLVFGFVIYSFIYNGFLDTADLDARGWAKQPHDGITALARATLFAIGGLWIGYGTTRFVKEDSKRYSDMRGQFGAARQKVDSMLDEYRSAIDEGRDEKELNQFRSGIQELFLTLGRESLHEQTEWLLMRRSRPVEPVAKVR